MHQSIYSKINNHKDFIDELGRHHILKIRMYTEDGIIDVEYEIEYESHEIKQNGELLITFYNKSLNDNVLFYFRSGFPVLSKMTLFTSDATNNFSYFYSENNIYADISAEFFRRVRVGDFP